MDADVVASVEFFAALVAVAALVGAVAVRTGVPYSVALVLFGLALATFGPRQPIHLIPSVVLAALLPGLVFEAAYHTDLGALRRTFGGVVHLAVPGVLISAAVVGGVLTLATGLPFARAFLIGAIVSATDPAAVVAAFRRLRAPERLSTLVEAESLLNDGTAVVVFSIALASVSGDVSTFDAVVEFVTTILVSAAIGSVTGLLAWRFVVGVNDHLVELTASVALAYGTYLIADHIHESGIIATVVAGMVLGSLGHRRGISERTLEALDTVWEFVAFLLTALVFLLVGLAMTGAQLVDALVPIAWTVLAVLAARAFAVYGLVGGGARLLRATGRDPEMPIGWFHVMFWSGLRGAVAVALALSLPVDLPGRDLMQAVVFGVVLFTLVVQGTTADWLVHRTGVSG